MQTDVDGLPKVPPPLWKEKQAEHAPAVVILPVPEGFAHEEALKRLAFLIVGQLETGMTEREIARRLHGRIDREGE